MLGMKSKIFINTFKVSWRLPAVKNLSLAQGKPRSFSAKVPEFLWPGKAAVATNNLKQIFFPQLWRKESWRLTKPNLALNPSGKSFFPSPPLQVDRPERWGFYVMARQANFRMDNNEFPSGKSLIPSPRWRGEGQGEG